MTTSTSRNRRRTTIIMEEEQLVVAINRLVSSSSSDDVENALESLLERLGGDAASTTKTTTTTDVVEYLLHGTHDEPVLAALTSLVRSGKANDENSMAVASESCRSLAVRLLLKMTMDSHQQRSHVQYILEHSSHALESVLDVASDNEIPVAARIQSIRLLGQWTKILPSIAIPQWLSTPNGIHRAGDLLRDEYIRSEGLLLAVELSRHSAVAKIWIFADIIPVILALAVESGGGLTGGDMVVLDCFQVIQNIFAYTDANSAALVLENPVVLSMVSQFLDLRQGHEFLHPPPVVDESYKDDDLDALLSSNDDSAAGIMKKKKKRIMPKLLPAEEDVIGKVLDILRTILDHEKLRKEILRSKRNIGLIGLLWELALFVLPPNDDIAIPCAVPSGELQRKTIHLLADGLAQNAMDSLLRHGGIDRVLHMVCTSSDRGLVQALLYLIRMVLPTDAANEMLMECLAPAPDHYVDNDDSNDTQQPQPQQVGIVHKLLYTAISQLNITSDEELDETLLVGSLGALGLFLTDDAQRSILYKITLQQNEMNNNNRQSELLTGLLTCLQKRGDNAAQQDDFVTFHLWRFLALWMTDATLAEVLRNADAAQFLVNSQHDMAALILGLGLLYLNDERQSGGWTKANVLQALLPHQQWNQKMERLCKEQQQQQPSSSNNPMYWFFRPEEKVWCTWCEQHVLQIRQQVVREMTTSAHHNGNEQDLALSKIVDDQTLELNTLRIELAKTQRRVEAQGTRTLLRVCLVVLFVCQ
jgi:hypothetical protein